MKRRSNPFVALALVLFSTASGQAALYWNANSGAPDYSGTWDGTTSNWNTATGGAGTQTVWVAGEDAEFDVAAPYTVTVGSAQTANNVSVRAGSVTLSGTSTVSSANLVIDSGASLTGNSDRFLKVGTTTLTVNGTLNQTAGVTASTQRVILAGGNGNIVFSGGFRTGGNFNFAGNISGTGSILTDVAGAFTLSGNNTYTGDTLIRSGNTVRLASTTALSDSTFLRFGGNTNIVELAAGDFSRTVGSGAGFVRFNAGADGAGNPGFAAVNADRTVTLGGTLTWGGGLFNPSAFHLGSAASTHKVTFTSNFDLNGAARTVSSTNGAAAVEGEISGVVSNSSATASSLAKTGTGYVLLSGSIDDSAAGTIGLTASGGTLEISGPGTTSFRGNISVGGGNLLVKRNDALGTGPGTTTVSGANAQGILQFDASGGDLTFAEDITLQMRSSLVTSNTSPMKPNFSNVAGNTTLTGIINGTTGGAVTKISSDAGLLTITNELRQSGATPTASTRISTLQGAGNAVVSGTVTQAANITHRIEKMGTGTWKFSNPANTFTGGVRLYEGTLEVTGVGNGGANGVLGAASNAASNIQFNGGTLKYSGAGETSDRLFSVGPAGGTIDASGEGSLELGNTGDLVTADGGATGIQFTFPTGSTTVAVNDLTALSPGQEIGGYAGLEPGTKIVSIDYSASILTIDTPTTAVSGVVASNGTASGVIDRVLTLTGANTGANRIAGNLSNAANGGKLAVTKTGAGQWVLSGANTYTGATSVQAGTLSLVGGSQASPITVASGATLGFTVGSPVASTSTLTFSGASAKVSVTGTPAAATLMSATSITGVPVLDPAIPGFELAIEGGGTLLNLKATAVATNYSTWAAVNGVPGQAANLDHDQDGVPNGVEYLLGGPNAVTTGFTALPGVTTTGGVRSITWTKAADYTGVYGSDFVVETSSTLANGSWTAEASPGTVTLSGNNITYTFPAGPLVRFARLKVTGP